MTGKAKQAKAIPAPPAAQDKTAAPQTATEEAIAVRAYEIYLGRGGSHGSDIDDWLQAERELNLFANVLPAADTTT